MQQSIFSIDSVTSNISAQTTNGTMNMSAGNNSSNSSNSSSAMQGMGSGGGMQGMQSMDNMQGSRGSIKEMCDKMNDMPTHYCEPSYNIMSSFMGVKIDKITPTNNKELQVQLKYLGNSSTAIDKDIVIVGGGEDLAGSNIVPSGWKNSTTVPLIFEGTGSIFSSPSIMMHIFPLTFNK